jgi:hypothetical protein
MATANRILYKYAINSIILFYFQFIINIATKTMGLHSPHACLRSCFLTLLYSATSAGYQSLISGRLRLSIIVAQFDNPNDGNKNKSPHTLLPSPGLSSSSILYPSASTDSWLMVVCLSLISSHLWRPVYHSISLVGPFSFSAHHTQRNQQWQELTRCCAPATDP